MDEVAIAWRRAWERPDRRQIWEWARENVSLPSSYAIEGAFRIETSRYLELPFKLIADDLVRQVNILKGVQTAGTLIADIWLQWLLANAPGPTMFVLETDEDADQHYRTRLSPTFERSSNAPIWAERRAKRDLTQLPGGMDFYCTGANLSSLQSKSIRYLICDEVWRWKQGHMLEAFGRTKGFPFTCQILTISQGGVEGDDWCETWRAGKQFGLQVDCLKCGHTQPYDFFGRMLDDEKVHAGVVWDEALRSDGSRDIARAASTARFRCMKCGHEHPDEPRSWSAFNANLSWRDQEPDKPMRNCSLRWPSVVRGVWGTLVEQFLRALDIKDSGSVEPLKKFYQKELALFWQEALGEEKIDLQTHGYQMGEEWSRKHMRFMTADYQEGRGKDTEHYWVCVRDWSTEGTGDSRLVWYGRLDTEDDVRAKQLELGIKDPCVCVDGGNELLKVARTCARFGWTVLEGSHRESFSHARKNAKPVSKPFSPRRWIDPGRGTKQAKRRRVASFMWSNPSVKSLTWNLRHGRGAEWLLPRDLPDEYRTQIDSEVKQRIINPKTGSQAFIWKVLNPSDPNNHGWDCENMQTVCALIANLLPYDLDDVNQDDPHAKDAPQERPGKAARVENEQQLELAVG